MADQKPGRESGPVNMQTVRRRPAFRTSVGDFEADVAGDALNAARADGRVSGDLRGKPAPDAPGESYVGNQRRRRPPVQGVVPASVREASERDDETETDIRASRRSERDPRNLDEREFTEDRQLTDADRLAMLRAGYFRVALPDLPRKPGFHRVWLTTTNSRDPIAARLRMGYRLLRFEDLGPGWEQQKATSGEYAGHIAINEMIAAELPMRLYQMYMEELHHNMPREQERGIYGNLDAQADALKELGSALIYEDKEENAFTHIRRHRAKPESYEG